MVAASNLADLLAHLVTEAPEQAALLVAEGPPLSSAELFRLLQRGFGRREWSLPFDLSPLLRTARFSPVDGLLERLLGSLEVDADRLFAATGWAPPASTEDALAATARWYAAR
jgi:UDP-glucose 4-epimerase